VALAIRRYSIELGLERNYRQALGLKDRVRCAKSGVSPRNWAFTRVTFGHVTVADTARTPAQLESVVPGSILGGDEMKRNPLSWFLTFAAMLVFSISAFAQHGAAGMGGGRPTGAGSGSAGAPSGVGSGNSGRPSDIGSTGMGHSSTGSQSPTTVLDNSKLNTSLTNALEKSGISVPGGNLQSACSGFKTLGQCIAAMHVAKNLDIPGGFDALKDKMTGSNAVSLGKAIQEFSPNANAKTESKKGSKQADQDIRASESES
jgi:hypothetical protein